MKNRVASSGQLRALVRQNIRLAKRLKSGQLGVGAIDRLRDLTKKFGFSLALGDFEYLDSGWYVTHGGLLRWPNVEGVSGSGSMRCATSATQYLVGGFLRPLSTRVLALGVSPAMAMRTVSMYLLSSMVPRCVLLRRVPSTVHSERPMASGCARSRSSAGNRRRMVHLIRNALPRLATTMAIRTVSLASVIASAF